MSAPASMTPQQIAERKLPSGRVWHFKQESAFAAAGNGDIIIAHDFRRFSDKKNKMVTVKAYSYLTADELVALLQNTQSADNHVYELIRGKCKGYFDIEKTIAAPDLVVTSDDFLAELLPALHDVLSEKIGPDVEFAVLDGSRTVGTEFKLSFHVVLTNIAMESNCDGGMLDIANALDDKLPDCVDLGVYSKHRVFRCPFATKLGDTVGLSLRMAASSPSLRGLSTEDFIRKALVTVFDDSVRNFVPQLLGVRRADPAADRPPKRRRTGGAAAGEGGSAAGEGGSAGINYEQLKNGLQQLLIISGDSKTSVTGFRQIETNGKFSYNCRNEGFRRCLLDPELQVQHDSNQCMLFAEMIDDKFVVQYRCLTPNCPAAHAFGNNGGDVGALMSSGNSYNAYRGEAAARRVRAGMSPLRILNRPAPIADAVVQDYSDDDESWEVRVVDIRGVVQKMHVFNDIVFKCLVNLALARPECASAFEDIFIEYHMLRKPKHMISMSMPWILWKEAMTRPAVSEAPDVVISNLKAFAAKDAADRAFRYAKGILVSNRKVDTELALTKLLEEYPCQSVIIQMAIDHVRALKCPEIKRFDDMYEELEISPTPIESLEHPLDVMRYIYLECQSFDAVKEIFNDTTVFIRDGGMYVTYDPSLPEIELRTADAMKKSYPNKHYLELVNGKLVVKTFIDTWIKSKGIWTYDTMRPDPQHVRDDSRNYNIWRPFRASLQRPIDQKLAEELAAPFFKHIKEVLCGGIEEEFAFMQRWLASIIQRPWRKTEIAVVLISGQGAGKNLFTEFLREKLFGEALAVQTSDPEHDLYGRFSNTACGKSMIIANEAHKMHRFASLIKDNITSRTLRMEVKGGKIYNSIESYANYIFTTNSPDAFSIDRDDRRMFIPTIKVTHTRDAEEHRRHFAPLVESLNHELAAVAVLQVLLKVDLKNFDEIINKGRPVTALHKLLSHTNLGIVALFLSAIVNTPLPSVEKNTTMIRVKGADMHKLAMRCNDEWCTSKKKTLYGEVKMQMGEIMGDTGTTVNGSACYTFSKQMLKDRLTTGNRYANDIELPEYHGLKVTVCAAQPQS